MKRNWMLIVLSTFILILTACGQGASTSGSEPETDGIESVENGDLGEGENEGEEDSTEPEEVEDTPENTPDEEVETDEENTEGETPDGEVTETPVELVFSDDQVMDMFRVERTIEATDDDLFVATLEAWIDGPTEDGLASLLPEGVTVQSVEEKDGVAHVSFSSELLDAQVGSGTEEMLLQQIAMAMKQFGFNETQILIDGEAHDELFGHIDTSVPVVANDLENYEKVE